MGSFMMRCRQGGLAAIALLVVAAPTSAADQEPKPAKKDDAKQPDPLKALKDAYSKGVSITPVEVKDLPKAISEGAAKARPGAVITKAQRLEIKHTLKYVAFDKPRVQSYQAVLVNGDKSGRKK